MKNPLGFLLNTIKTENNDPIQSPGDNISLRMTDSRRKVLKVDTTDVKYSATQYPNGTIVETKTTRKKK